MNHRSVHISPLGIEVRGLRKTERWIGAYILRVHLNRASDVQVGRMNRGMPLPFHKGDYIYIGSAMGHNAGLYLPRRLVRHATRSGGLPDHDCRAALLSHFENLGLDADRVKPRRPKRLHWNIDFLLDDGSVELRDILYVRSERRLEEMIVRYLELRPTVSAPFPGFGAHDHPGHSHLLCIDSATTWRSICQELESLLETSS